jgi:thiamine-monophosphate kinase
MIGLWHQYGHGVGMDQGEFAFIERMARLLPAAPAGQTWIGDDAAVLEGGVLFATDVVVEGVHFDFAWTTAEDAGWKALAVNVSDLAAMGGSPWAAVVCLVVPPDRPGLADGVGAGLAEAADALGCPLVGGDTSNGPVCTIAVAVLGRSATTGPVLRSGARPGDAIFVTGPLGAAAAALRRMRQGATPGHLALQRLRRPAPRVVEGQAAAEAGAGAMIDVSDGLAADLGHICDRSRVGVALVAASIPHDEGVDLGDALHGGDDYELCFCAPDPGRVRAAFAARGLAQPFRIGTITAEPARLLVADDGSTCVLAPSGWQHGVSGPA